MQNKMRKYNIACFPRCQPMHLRCNQFLSKRWNQCA